MNEEILRIQKMVAEGKITPEEGAELVETVRSGGTSTAAGPPSKPKGKAVGIIAISSLGLGVAMLLLTFCVACNQCQGHGLVFSPALIFLAGFLFLLAIVLGIIGWRSSCGKVAVFGGLILPVLLITIMVYGLFHASPAQSCSECPNNSPTIETMRAVAQPLLASSTGTTTSSASSPDGAAP